MATGERPDRPTRLVNLAFDGPVARRAWSTSSTTDQEQSDGDKGNKTPKHQQAGHQVAHGPAIGRSTVHGDWRSTSIVPTR